MCAVAGRTRHRFVVIDGSIRPRTTTSGRTETFENRFWLPFMKHGIHGYTPYFPTKELSIVLKVGVWRKCLLRVDSGLWAKPECPQMQGRGRRLPGPSHHHAKPETAVDICAPFPGSRRRRRGSWCGSARCGKSLGALQVQLFHLGPGPRRAPQELQAGGDAGVMGEAADRDCGLVVRAS